MISGISSSTASLSEMRQKMFNQIDTSGDGSIDKNEMAALIEQNTSTLVEDLFSKVDTDQDGLISQIESDSGLAKMGQQMKHGGAGMSAVSGTQPPPPPEKVFDTADVNEDGVVSKEELSAVIGQNGNNIDDLFSKVDTDGDGVISRIEDETFRQQMTERMQQKEAANSGTTVISSFGQSWQNELLGALLKGLTAAAGSSGESTSVYA
ncbi:MAG: EF-hand domain-containing protein [Syntrophales bacterium]|nr:EF-hand domain-containing protein [Syntrophales bacterium]